MKIGIFGGSFNPIHNGHLIMAEYIREACHLDKILIIPCGKPCHREHNYVSDNDRINMINLAIESNIYFELSDIEINSTKTSYTYDTLVNLKKLYPNDEFYEIIGEDSADYLTTWKNYEEMLKLCKFIVFKRRGFNYEPEHKNIKVLDSPYIEISSTMIRDSIKNQKSVKYLLPDSLIKYITTNNLYGG